MTTHLTAAQRASLEADLRARRRELEGQLAHQLDGGTRPQHARDMLLQDGDDASARDADREVDLARSDQDLSEMRAVNEALVKLETSQFGLCIDCESPIPFDRLRLGPQVLRCVACQTKHEAGGDHTSR
ncbi:MAG: TraR/DksA family transcriptional regulator, partial [Burkholderiales bacterium]